MFLRSESIYEQRLGTSQLVPYSSSLSPHGHGHPFHLPKTTMLNVLTAPKGKQQQSLLVSMMGKARNGCVHDHGGS
ncbi:hypothetical protein D5086_030918 [Populus alba]|uniref:Uncharacterized protein n=2 Tax=Populus TaxID=3689 RepID=A0ACC4AQT5_POPAL